MQINYIDGIAGTGKSTKLIELVLECHPEETVVITPTHKACQVLRDKLEHRQNYEIKTVHALLGWVPGINEDAENINHVDTTIKLTRELPEYTHIFIDEMSMLSEDMLFDLTSKIEAATNFESDHITLTLIGDLMQLPPVKGTAIETDPTTTTHLTEQFRSESPDIVETFTKFVHFLEGTNTSDLTIPESENINYVTDLSNFKQGDRLLAYTNKAVGKYNKKIAKLLGIDSYIGQEVQLGSRLETEVVKRFVKPTIKDLMTWFESGKLVLQNSQINKKYLQQNLQALLNQKEIEFIETNTGVFPVIIGIGDANELRKAIKEKAVDSKIGSPSRGKAWSRFYATERAFTMDYTFASTIHKAQGQEFKTVWIDKGDIAKSIFKGNYNTYARLTYVALSRAIKTVNIIEG